MCTGLQDQVDCNLSTSPILRELLGPFLLEIQNFPSCTSFLSLRDPNTLPRDVLLKFLDCISIKPAMDIKISSRVFLFILFFSWHHAALPREDRPLAYLACFLSTLLLITFVHLAAASFSCSDFFRCSLHFLCLLLDFVVCSHCFSLLCQCSFVLSLTFLFFDLLLVVHRCLCGFIFLGFIIHRSSTPPTSSSFLKEKQFRAVDVHCV